MTLSTEQQRGAATANGAVAAAEEYAASELPASERHSTLSITLVRMGYTVSATDLLFGMSLGLYFLLLFVLPLDAGSSHGIDLCSAFYRSGALVFGGGHVVLPLLQSAVVGPGWISPGDFLAGYGAAQAVPGHRRDQRAANGSMGHQDDLSDP